MYLNHHKTEFIHSEASVIKSMKNEISTPKRHKGVAENSCNRDAAKYSYNMYNLLRE